MGKLKNKMALVSGESKGIVASIAKNFADEGAKDVVNYASTTESAENLVKTISDRGELAIAVQEDVSQNAGVSRLFREIKEKSVGLQGQQFLYQAVNLVTIKK